MENPQQYLSKFFSQIAAFWNGLTTTKQMVAGGVVLALVSGAIFALSQSQAAPYEYIFKELGPADSQAIASYFKRAGYTTFQTDAVGIKVPRGDAARLRLELAQEGIPAHGVVGWEKFDTQEFARTEFEQRINKQRAIQGELSRTIMMIEGVTSAKVHIVSPKKSLFVQDQKEPTAAVYIKTRRGTELEKKQIKGIVHMVSRAVEGLSPSNITIIDAGGKMLTEVEAEDYTSKMTKEMMNYKRGVEGRYEENVRAIVGRVVGPERVEVKVDAVVDFTQEQQTISDIDPEGSVVISRETTGFSLQGSGLNPTGIPGSKSNVPGEQENLAATQATTENKKDAETINYELSKTISQKTLPVGSIVRLSAAVLVDGKQIYPPDGSVPDFVGRSTEELAQIGDLVKSAIGFNEKRGDVVTVRNMMFQLDPVQLQSINEEKQVTRQYISTLSVSAASAFALVLFFLFVVRPYFRWLSYDPDRKKAQQVVEEYKPDMEVGALQNVHIKEDVPFEKLSPQEQVLFLAKNEPKRTTEAIRLMLNPHHNAGG